MASGPGFMKGRKKRGRKEPGMETRKEEVRFRHFVGYYINNQVIECKSCKRSYISSRALASKIFLADT